MVVMYGVASPVWDPDVWPAVAKNRTKEKTWVVPGVSGAEPVTDYR